nr:unnamed protein product [Callosobruchus chinensis]
MPKDRRCRKYSRRLGSLRRILERLEKRLGSDDEESSESSLTDVSGKTIARSVVQTKQVVPYSMNTPSDPKVANSQGVDCTTE